MAFIYNENNNIFSGDVWSNPTDGGTKSGPITVTQDGLVTNTVGNGLELLADNATDSYSITIDGIVSTTDAANAGLFVGSKSPLPVFHTKASTILVGTGGQITGGSYGLTASAANLTNKGVISGDTAVFLAGEAFNILLDNTGVIDTTSTVAIDASTTGTFTVKNIGTIDGALNFNSAFILAATGSLNLTNSGKMGAVISNGADDVVKNTGTMGDVDLGDGNNTLTSSTQVFKYIGGSGNDTLTVSGFFAGNTTLGDGNNTVTATVANTNGNITAGNGIDKITLSGNLNGSATLGDGNNVLSVKGTVNGNVTTGIGNDSITVVGGINGGVTMGNGTNIVTVNKNVAGTITMGVDDDKATIDGSVFGSIILGEGNNTLSVGAKVANSSANGNITAGAGNDSVTVIGKVTGAVDLMGGTNTLVVKGSGTGAVSALDGNDKFTLEGSFLSAVKLGDGTNTVTLKGTATSIEAGKDDDTITLTGSASVGVDAGAGKNTIVITGTSAVVNAGNGDDKLTLNGDSNSIILGDGKNTLKITDTDNKTKSGTIQTGSGDDNITLTGDASIIIAGGGKNSITVKGNLNGISATDGDDVISVAGGLGLTGIQAGDGANTISYKMAAGVTSTPVIQTGNGADKISVTGNLFTLKAGDGKNTINVTGSVNFDLITGVDDDAITLNVVSSFPGTTKIASGAGNDTVKISGNNESGDTFLGSGNDIFTGSAFDDEVTDEEGGDEYTLGAGNDTFLATGTGANIGLDNVDAGAGNDDLYSAVSASNAVVINLSTVTTQNLANTISIVGGLALGTDVGTDNIKGFESFIGGSAGDFAVGNAFSNELNGFSGNDELHGGDGNDVLIGGKGADLLYGGKGRDTLTGGVTAGEIDRFIYVASSDSTVLLGGRDLITDFTDGSDLIDLTEMALASLVFRTDDVFLSVLGTAQVRAIETAIGWTLQFDTNGDRKVDMAIDVTDTAHNLNWDQSDFDF